MKASNLNFGQRAHTRLVYDPRPQHKHNLPHYNTHVRSLVLNWSFTPRIPISHMYAPANPYAIDVDHDYLAERQSDTFMRTLEVTAISAERIAMIERSTRQQSMHALWMQERSKRITASNFGRIVKATDRVDMSALLNSLLRPRKLDNVPAIKHGRKYEYVALAAYSKQTGQTVVGCGLFICPTNSFLAATPDGLVEPALLVEVKCPYTRRDEAITPITVPYLKECDGGLQLDHKHDYYHQIQGQLMITGKKRCDLVVSQKST